MLLCQKFGWCHHHCLLACLHRRQHGSGRDHGLAAADVSLQQTQ